MKPLCRLENLIHNRCKRYSNLPSTGSTKKYVSKRTKISKPFNYGHSGGKTGGSTCNDVEPDLHTLASTLSTCMESGTT